MVIANFKIVTHIGQSWLIYSLKIGLGFWWLLGRLALPPDRGQGRVLVHRFYSKEPQNLAYDMIYPIGNLQNQLPESAPGTRSRGSQTE